jgi:SAM-dependent methyltransferase
VIGLDLVRALEPAWQDRLDAVARGRGWPTSTDPTLGPAVAALSATYNHGDPRRARTRDALAARLAFSFPRDVPKAAGAVRELVAAGLLAVPADRPLRVLDLGAGFGAMHHGVARALESAGQTPRLAVTAVDADANALAAAAELADPTWTFRSTVGGLAPVGGRHDLVVLGQVLAEDDAEPAVHAALIERLLAQSVDPGGSLVIVEPALRERTRHLHAVRAALIAGGRRPFAPCLHARDCPMLATPRDWCHEDLPVDLPDWLVPVARAAGLRWERLTFAYLVVRPDGASLRDRLPIGPRCVRAVSNPLISKGKSELFVCGDGAQPGERVMRLDREKSDANATWNSAARGDILAIPDGNRVRTADPVIDLGDAIR